MGRDYYNRGGRNQYQRGGRGGNRGGFRGRGRGGGSFQKYDKRDNNWQTSERLLETEAGITQFVSADEGFHGIIKSR